MKRVLQRTRELHHRLLACEPVTHLTLFRQQMRWPCFMLSRHDAKTGHRAMEKAGLPLTRLGPD